MCGTCSPYGDVALDWAERYGLGRHWCVERLVQVLLNLRQSSKSPDDPKIFDPRYRIAWVTFGDY
jgi:hypothetical protein